MKKIVLGCAAVLLSLGLLAGCNKEEDNVGPGPVVENPDSGEDGGDGGDTGSEVETTLIKLGAFTEPTASYHYASDTNSTSSSGGLDTVATWESAPWITVTKVTGGATLSVEVSGVTEYLAWAGEGSTSVSWGEEAFTWSWDEDFGTFGVVGDSKVQTGARYLALSSDSSDSPYVRAYATSGSYVAVVPYTAKPEDVVLPTSYTEVTTLEEGGSYLLGIEIGETLYFFNGKLTYYYYLSVSSSYLSAVEVTTTAVAAAAEPVAIDTETESSDWGLSFELDGAAKEIYAYQGESSSAEGTYYNDLGICEKGATLEEHNATKTFTWDPETYSFSVTFADDPATTKILGLESTSSFKEIALVDATSEVEVEDVVPTSATTVNNLRAHLYTPVFAAETPAE